MRLGSVVLIDQVEKAPMSVFSGLISLLDYRFLTHYNGACTIDISDTIIIMVSDLGNMDFISEMFEEASERRKMLFNWQQPDSGDREFPIQVNQFKIFKDVLYSFKVFKHLIFYPFCQFCHQILFYFNVFCKVDN